MTDINKNRRFPVGTGYDVPLVVSVRAVLSDMEATPFLSREKTGAYLVLRYLGMKEEYGMALFFSGRGMLLGECALQKGSYVFSNEFCDIILETGSCLGASSFIIAHNHVLSRPIPSAADTMTTGRIEEFFSKRELIFADHFIVAGSDYTTMKTKGYWTKRYDGKTLEIE